VLRACERLRIRKANVRRTFPLFVADYLREHGVELSIAGDFLAAGRRRYSLQPTERLARLMGRRRALLLTALRAAKSLDQLALEAGIARSTASEHLSALAEIGLVVRDRDGRLARYRLSDDGCSLLELLSSEVASRRRSPN
jgi:DNA-binding transcriptional ArsR family regulator